jgi:hypothetical protein
MMVEAASGTSVFATAREVTFRVRAGCVATRARVREAVDRAVRFDRAARFDRTDLAEVEARVEALLEASVEDGFAVGRTVSIVAVLAELFVDVASGVDAMT